MIRCNDERSDVIPPPLPAPQHRSRPGREPGQSVDHDTLVRTSPNEQDYFHSTARFLPLQPFRYDLQGGTLYAYHHSPHPSEEAAHRRRNPLTPSVARRGYVHARGERLQITLSPHAELRRPAFSVWAVDSSCPYPSSFGSVCSVPAKAEKFFGAFAAFLQRPKSFSRRLQHSCKGQKVFRGICSIPANVFFFENRLADPPAKPISQSLITHF